MDRRSLALLCDYYEITMSNGYFDLGMRDQIAYFDVFFRNNPEGGGYSVASGIEQIARYVKELRFSESDM
ncbi:MAG: nicotinate phosphoribosyltransferase, partial [Clostridia bacterium]|nr:nicotinate phosphoribosyltransferase [Clostridia bacterium]